jgi:hypothetical protein
MSGEGFEQAQLLESMPPEGTHTAVESSGYFGSTVEAIETKDLLKYDLSPKSGGDLHRHSYLYQVVYKISENEYGGIQIRGRTWTYAANLREDMRSVLRQTAHRAAHCFNSGIQTSAYARGPGYLDGFAGWETTDPQDSSAIEHEPVRGSDPAAQAGKVDWNVEVYVDDSFAEPDLSGIAQGIADPWTTETTKKREEPPRETYKLRYLESRDEYEIQTRTGTRARGKNVLAGKTTYVNDKPVGVWKENRGRQSIKADYTRAPTLEGRQLYDRERLIEETAATPQAIRDGGNLYKVEETEGAIYFVTAARKPDEWDPTPSEDIPEDMGVTTETTTRLKLRTESEASAITCRRDETIIRHLGESLPEWTNRVTREWRA